MKVRDLIAFPFMFIGFLFVFVGLRIGGYFTAKQLEDFANILQVKLSGLQPKRV